MTTTELLQGTPLALKTRVDALIAASKVIDMIVPTSDKSWYLICYH